MSKEDIKNRIREILKDERLFYPTANVLINAPLAMVQIQLQTELWTLQNVIGEINTDILKMRKSK
ncbi:hypothetical protein ACTS95_08070 [Empedobacter brevis]